MAIPKVPVYTCSYPGAVFPFLVATPQLSFLAVLLIWEVRPPDLVGIRHCRGSCLCFPHRSSLGLQELLGARTPLFLGRSQDLHQH